MSYKQQFMKYTLFLFGSFTFGWTMGTFLHELGHAIAMWGMGGTVKDIVINPLSWSYTYYGSFPKYPQITTWAGAILGSAMGLVLFFAVKKRRSPFLVPFLFMGLSPVIEGGGYYLVDVFLELGGDASRLIELGVPEFLVVGTGCLLLIAGIAGTVYILPRTGFIPQDTLFKRFILLCSGILPLFILNILYALVWAKKDILMQSVVAATALCLIGILTWASLKFIKKDVSFPAIEWKHVRFAILLGLSALVIPYLIVGI